MLQGDFLGFMGGKSDDTSDRYMVHHVHHRLLVKMCKKKKRRLKCVTEEPMHTKYIINKTFVQRNIFSHCAEVWPFEPNIKDNLIDLGV